MSFSTQTYYIHHKCISLGICDAWGPNNCSSTNIWTLPLHFMDMASVHSRNHHKIELCGNISGRVNLMKLRGRMYCTWDPLCTTLFDAYWIRSCGRSRRDLEWTKLPSELVMTSLKTSARSKILWSFRNKSSHGSNIGSTFHSLKRFVSCWLKIMRRSGWNGANDDGEYAKMFWWKKSQWEESCGIV